MAKHTEKQARTWAMLCHLSALACWLGVPFGNILGPLLVWLIKKDELPIVEEQGKESLNFQISMTIYFVAAIILFVLTLFMGVFVLGIFVLVGLGIAHVVLVIIASVKASNGEDYSYPYSLHFLH
ncbi:DUF4870 domain-containing protein [bacterium]|nr:DUF4870 domain-containing protein [bacterium]